MNRELTLLAGGIGLGAALMYLLDPDRGRRRRALVRDQLASVANKTPDAMATTARDLSNRARGLAAEARSMFSSEEVTDEVLIARVRSKLGRVVSDPHALEVADEVDDLLSCVRSVPGIAEVENRLEAHEQAGNVPALQGGRPRPGDRSELMQENWSPTMRLLVGTAGSALTVYGLSRRDPLSLGLGALGVGLLARSLTNTEVKRLVGASASP